MRLINTTRITLHEFFGNSMPLYAILSHRWEGAEVTFQDMNNGKAVQMKGYAKVLGCCAQARKDGFEYAWIDSCCIDKTSSSELSEAINSMFRWYQNAEVCYAYLSDVPATDNIDHDQYNSEFRQSKWFSRGWTLQELLAPEIVVFYNHDWIEIGTKASMSGLISSLTNIDAFFLMSPSRMKSACVAQKMSWASERQTTRLEDRAYCLMGLFDVNMPLLYGEGKKAFHRLQLEIIKNSSDESIFAWGVKSVDKQNLQGIYDIYGIIAENPSYFKNCGDILSETSLRPPYSMTNRGLQLAASLVQISKPSNGSLFSRGGFNGVQWALNLYCRRRHDDSRRLSIHVIEDENRQIWGRASDVVYSSSAVSGWHTKDNDEFEKRQIIIQATRPEARPWIDVPPGYFFLLDARSPMEHGFLVYVHAWERERGSRIIKLENDGRYMTPMFYLMTFECRKGQYSFQLNIRCTGRINRDVEISAELNNIDLVQVQEKGVRLESGEIIRAILKRKVHNGTRLYVVELRME